MKSILKYGIVLLLLFAVLAIGYRIYNKPHRDIRGADSDVRITATELFRAFEADEQAANERFLDKLVEVSGEVREVKRDEGQISLLLESGDPDFGVLCQLDPLSQHHRDDFETGEELRLRGVCTGKLMDVVLVRCVEL